MSSGLPKPALISWVDEIIQLCPQLFQCFGHWCTNTTEKAADTPIAAVVRFTILAQLKERAHQRLSNPTVWMTTFLDPRFLRLDFVEAEDHRSNFLDGVRHNIRMNIDEFSVDAEDSQTQSQGLAFFTRTCAASECHSISRTKLPVRAQWTPICTCCTASQPRKPVMRCESYNRKLFRILCVFRTEKKVKEYESYEPVPPSIDPLQWWKDN